jgi:hypothetical protein
MADIHRLNVITRLDRSPAETLDRARESSLSSVVVIGWHESGDFYFASSVADGGAALWLLEMAKRKLLEQG